MGILKKFRNVPGNITSYMWFYNAHWWDIMLYVFQNIVLPRILYFSFKFCNMSKSSHSYINISKKNQVIIHIVKWTIRKINWFKHFIKLHVIALKLNTFVFYEINLSFKERRYVNKCKMPLWGEIRYCYIEITTNLIIFLKTIEKIVYSTKRRFVPSKNV